MDGGLNLTIYKDAFDAPEKIFQRLENEIVYLPEEHCRIKSKSFSISRKIVAYGDPNISYTFSGLTLTSQPWIPLLLEMKNSIENVLGTQFNFVLINRYENGNAWSTQKFGQYKNNKVDLSENTCICCISFGENRTMIFKRPGCEKKVIDLKSNSMLVMKPPINELWNYGIPIQKKCTGVCINLTFKKIKTASHDLNKNNYVDSKLKPENNNKLKHVVSKRKLDQQETTKDEKRKKTEPFVSFFCVFI